MPKIPIDPTKPLVAQIKPHGLIGRRIGVEYLYRFRDSESSLLYIGITAYPDSRWQSHKNNAEWWSLAASVEWEIHAVGDAVNHELREIKTLHPAWNKRGAIPHLTAEPRTRHSRVRCIGNGMEWKGRGMEGRTAVRLGFASWRLVTKGANRDGMMALRARWSA